MESLSRPFESRKLSNVKNKHPYDGVFSGHRHKYAGAKAIDVDDYREIFGSSKAASSSIPVLDVSTLGEHSDAFNVNMLTSKPDYSNIFGFRHDVAVSYQQLFDSDKFRPPSSTTTTSPDSYDLCRQSSDGLKQFKVSYNKISQKSKELDETKHVTQLHAIPGFTRFIDERAPPPKMKSQKQKSSPVHVSVDSTSPINVANHKSYPKRSTTTNSMSYKTDTSTTSFDEELDVNSAASALRKAIEKAQESIRIAKESVGRKKKGLVLKVKDRTEDVIGATSSQVFPDFMFGEKLSVAKKVIDEMNGKFAESNKFKENNTIVSNSTRVTGETESKPFDSAGKYQYATSAYEAVHTEKTRTEPMEFVQEDQTMNMDVDDYEGKIEVIKTTAGALEHQNVDCEMKQEDNRTGERTGERLDNTFFQEFEKKPSCDEKVMEEIDSVGRIHESCKVDMNDDNVETTQEIDDATEATEGADALEEVLCETDKEDEYEVKSEENDVQSESSSGTIDGVKIEDDESNKEEDIIDNLADLGSENDVQPESSSSSAKTVEEESNTQLPHKEIPDTIKDSQEPQYRDKEDEIGEPGPSKVWGKEHFRRIDEATAREREHEKNRLAVNRAIREARERAFVEARERAERDRAAVEKATEEVRQRMMADAREKVAKASVATKSSSERTSAQSKLRAERAAVERATSEARQRALEKAMSQKSVSDLNSSESALRSKAKLEKHNRIMERAAKALAEKEKRDQLAQKEQAEKNRLAENLDANIERWSNGKEGNLRALLSTLQYILGPESGWQAVSLTEIITSSAVKKAYRKATLCVHPDKLQQRGATIQHKYICEKVFDLLKAAWNRFNSEEK